MRKKEEGYGSAIKACVAMGVILMIGVALTLLTGCGEKESSVTTEAPVSEIEETEPELPDMAASAIEEDDVAMTENFSLEAGAGAIGDGAATEVAEADSADVPDDAVLVDAPIDDPNELFRVSEEWAKEKEGLYAKIGDNFYSLMNQLPTNVMNYGIGWILAPDNYDLASYNNDEVKVYLDDVKELDEYVPSATRDGIVTSGDFSPLKIPRGAQLAIFGKSINTRFFKMDFVGYTIPAFQADTAMKYYPVVNHMMPNNILINHPGVFTLDGESVEDVRNLEYGKEYLYECYLGTDYRELKVVANARCYTAQGDAISLAVEPSKLGYFVVDSSELDPGFYICQGCEAVFEIVE